MQQQNSVQDVCTIIDDEVYWTKNFKVTEILDVIDLTLDDEDYTDDASGPAPSILHNPNTKKSKRGRKKGVNSTPQQRLQKMLQSSVNY